MLSPFSQCQTEATILGLERNAWPHLGVTVVSKSASLEGAPAIVTSVVGGCRLRHYDY